MSAVRKVLLEVTVNAYAWDPDEIVAALPTMMRYQFSNSQVTVTARQVEPAEEMSS